ncbi:MAG: type II secretion system F family protein [Syntrophomonadaceae bacterium]|jgi:tight adherence protein C
MTAAHIVLFVEIILVVLVALLGARNRSYREFVKTYGETFQLTFLAPAGLYLMDAAKIETRLGPVLQQVHEKIIRLHGITRAMDYTRMFLAQAIAAILLMPVVVSVIVVMADGGLAGIAAGLLVGPVAAYGLYMDLDKKIKQREQAIVMELPEFLNKIILLVNAGETVQEAMLRAVESKALRAEQEKEAVLNPLYVELQQVVNEMRNNRSFAEALQDLSKRCAVHEVSVLVTTMLLNYRKGGGDFVVSLRELARELWDKRIAVARILGEEASSKMVFPMVIILIVVMIIVGAPATMSM